MLIDWVTVGAQAINFLILVALLKRFLYQPILDAIDAREARIASELAEADARHAEAVAERDAFQRRNEAFDQERAARLEAMTAEVKAERHRLLEEARQAAKELTAKQRETLQREGEQLASEIARRVHQEVFAVARQALRDLADASLEQRVAEVFCSQLGGLDAAAKDRLGQAIASAAGPARVRVRSAFELPAEQRAAIEQVAAAAFATDLEIEFETVPELISGIELVANGQKLAWSLADYLAAVEQSAAALLRDLDQPAAPPA